MERADLLNPVTLDKQTIGKIRGAFGGEEKYHH